MSRPTKCRRICCLPQTLEFMPAKEEDGREPVILTVDEYEAIRLIDREGLSQEQCSQRMQVARTTAQKIYESARKKLADVLVEGLPLKIEGGEYRLCNGRNGFCNMAHCCKRMQAAAEDGGNAENLPLENGTVCKAEECARWHGRCES